MDVGRGLVTPSMGPKRSPTGTSGPAVTVPVDGPPWSHQWAPVVARGSRNILPVHPYGVFVACLVRWRSITSKLNSFTSRPRRGHSSRGTSTIEPTIFESLPETRDSQLHVNLK